GWSRAASRSASCQSKSIRTRRRVADSTVARVMRSPANETSRDHTIGTIGLRLHSHHAFSPVTGVRLGERTADATIGRASCTIEARASRKARSELLLRRRGRRQRRVAQRGVEDLHRIALLEVREVGLQIALELQALL